VAKGSVSAVSVEQQASVRSRRSSRGRSPDDERRLAKSADPAYMKFTTYIRRTTHLGVKTRLVSKRMEFSDLVERLLAKWLEENESIIT
jgi:hypothetical protein